MRAPWLANATPPLREYISPFTRKSLHTLSFHRSIAAVNGIWGSAINAVIWIVLVNEKEEINMVSDSYLFTAVLRGSSCFYVFYDSVVVSLPCVSKFCSVYSKNGAPCFIFLLKLSPY